MMKIRVVPVALVVAAGLLLGGCAHLAGGGSGASETLKVGTTQRGELTSGSHRNANDGSRFARYQVVLDADQVVRFALTSSFAGSLSLEAPEGDFITRSSTGSSGVTLTHRAGTAGTYVLSVNGEGDRSYGPFRVEALALDLRSSGVLDVGTEVAGWLNGENNHYTLEVSEAGLYTITQRSSEFDSFLRLQGNGLALQDDDSAGGLDARIGAYLQPGTYTVEAGWTMSQDRGGYTLLVTAEALPSEIDVQMDGELTHNSTLNGWSGGSAALSYQLVLEEQSAVTLEMNSSAIDAYLTLVGDGVYLTDDDSGDGDNGLNARISSYLLPGTYTVEASQVGSQPGLFTLRTTVDSFDLAERLRGLPTLTPPLEQDGHLNADQNAFRLTVASAGTYSIEMNSQVVDAYLELYGNGVMRWDDDGGDEGVNARLIADLPAGDYLLVARSFSPAEVGPYTLKITRF